MGFFDNLKNISKEAKKKSKEVKEELDKEFGDEQLYKDAKDLAKSTIDDRGTPYVKIHQHKAAK